ncbi:Aconitase A/isopropylmalate dehydratase small subunit swivel domain [Arabidopsis thaliana x Arabidopsis arenosa]|uniref:3-isopropylmalate dehydratase n=1 Tax=Arabidopsis thaliana x Arabidopsis arenosa TaxID=1240361 RepID=A0A8T1ZRT4_9BRAS|nr:Aconitase A/isopropylmalate dehydratase small subunit swivel domain [Arabidopsis thaliana x Arabidopsis arenosa]
MAISQQFLNPTLFKSLASTNKNSPTPFFRLKSTSTTFNFKPLTSSSSATIITRAAASSSDSGESKSRETFHGLCFVLKDNIDTDQIIPAEYGTLIPSIPEDREKLGSFALNGLPKLYNERFVEPGEMKSKYSVIIGGDNFGCGSSREHAPVCLGAAGAKAVVAESYARIFFRNCVATGEIFPLESEVRICDECKTGDVVTIEHKEDGSSLLINHTTRKEYKLKPLGDAGPVIDAGGIFAYARKAGMIPSASSA